MCVRVECYAGRKADERPVRFYVDSRAYMVTAILEQWYTPDGACFKVRADDGNVYVLQHWGAADEWSMEPGRST